MVPEPSDIFAISVRTNCVVAICVVLVASAAVGAVGVPVNAGLVDNTTNPVPVELLVPVPPLAILNGVVKLKVPDDMAVAVIVPVAKSPLKSRLTIVLGVLIDVAEKTDDAIVVIVDDKTPPTLFIVAAPVTSDVPLNAGLVYDTSPVVEIVLPVVNALALDAVPLKVPVMVPVEKPPLTSLLTIVLAVLSEVADNTEDDTVVIVDELTPPTLLTVDVNVPKPPPVTSPVNSKY